MTAVEGLVRLGGVGSARALRRFTSRRQIRRALRSGEIVRDGHARYALPTAEESRRAASRLSAVLGMRSAAAAHGWEMQSPPPRPELIVPRNRNVDASRRQDVVVIWADLSPEEVLDGVTGYLRTVLDCARRLPFDEALAIADSALRHGHITKAELLVAARDVRGKGRRRCLRVAQSADGRAANPFESVLRAIALDVAGLQVAPQVTLDVPGGQVRPDLVDTARRLVLEADSFAWHGSRRSLVRDCVRYNALALAGWLVLRFSWEHVMHRPAYVRWCLELVVSGTGERANAAPKPAEAA